LFFNDEPSSPKLYNQNLLAKSLFLFLIPYSTFLNTDSNNVQWKLKLFVSFSLLHRQKRNPKTPYKKKA
jgi:hypothetical protein